MHREDMNVLRLNHEVYKHLVTIRRGELTYNPVSRKVEPAFMEMVKVAGSGEAIECFYYRQDDFSCGIYENRFLECRLLKCWKPAAVLSVMGKDTILRSDVINQGDPVMQIIETHERECSLAEMAALIDEASYGEDGKRALGKLTELARRDMEIRARAIEVSGLKPEYELFVFGRPVWKILENAGLTVRTRKLTNGPGA